MEEATIDFNFKARYFKLGQIQENTEQIWFVCHGYGQLAYYFIRNFKPLDDGRHVVIAPEGLSRFYLEGFSGRVGATWMTRDNRLMDIDNYTAYLNEIYAKEIPSTIPAHIKINVLGFSQGAATVSRWIMQDQVHFDRLILWAGIFPSDIDLEAGHQKLKKHQIAVVHGTKDPFIDPEQEAMQQKLITALRIDPKRYTFNGAHEIESTTLAQLAADL